MTRSLLIIVCLLGLLVSAVGVHYLSFDRERVKKKISLLSKTTQITSPSFSSAYYEPRFLKIKAVNPAYPEMLSLDRKDAVYAK